MLGVKSSFVARKGLCRTSRRSEAEPRRKTFVSKVIFDIRMGRKVKK